MTKEPILKPLDPKRAENSYNHIHTVQTHADIHAYIRTYIHRYIHTYSRMLPEISLRSFAVPRLELPFPALCFGPVLAWAWITPYAKAGNEGSASRCSHAVTGKKSRGFCISAKTLWMSRGSCQSSTKKTRITGTLNHA